MAPLSVELLGFTYDGSYFYGYKVTEIWPLAEKASAA
jgi:hypothetical protein